jgi:hypothetical protein
MMEVLLASALTVATLIGLGNLDAARTRMEQDIRNRAGLYATDPEKEAALATLHLVRRLEQADRVVLLTSNPANIQVRTPLSPTNLSSAANYRWDQYRYDGGADVLVLYSETAGGCGQRREIAREIVGTTLNWMDTNWGGTSPPPAGGAEPFTINNLDNNIVVYSIQWSNGTRSRNYNGQVHLRGVPYSDINLAFPTDSGSGLNSPLMGVPPAACTS